MGGGRLRREPVEGFPLFVGGEARAGRERRPSALPGALAGGGLLRHLGLELRRAEGRERLAARELAVLDDLLGIDEPALVALRPLHEPFERARRDAAPDRQDRKSV